MKKLILAMALVGCICLLSLTAAFAKKAEIHNTTWKKNTGWMITQEGRTFDVEFGFRDDGFMLWQRGSEIK